MILTCLTIPLALAAPVTDEFGGDGSKQSVKASYAANAFEATVAGKITEIEMPIAHEDTETEKYLTLYIWREGDTPGDFEKAWSWPVTVLSTELDWVRVVPNLNVVAGDRIAIGSYDSADSFYIGYGHETSNDPQWGTTIGYGTGTSVDAPGTISIGTKSGTAKFGMRITFTPADADGDGYDALEDCDDGSAAAHSGGAEEWYDGVDGDCEGGSDFDADGDGDDSDGYGGGDCDDTDPAVHTGAREVWYDGVDQDCAGGDDFDEDGDGSTSSEYGGDDCDDTDPSVHPGADDETHDGIDSNCDGASDDDGDGDGYDSEDYDGDDCDDGDPSVHPGAEETWYDGTDGDCSGGSDFDQDGDGHDKDDKGGDDCDDTDATQWTGDVGACVGGDTPLGAGCDLCPPSALLLLTPFAFMRRRRRT